MPHDVDLSACATCGERDPCNPAVHPYSLDGQNRTDEPPPIPGWVGYTASELEVLVELKRRGEDLELYLRR
eukprot:3041386-Prymnesium_polylepis.1